MENRKINVHITNTYKNVINKHRKKERSDYILHIDRILKNKIGHDFSIMNKYQAFILNYELHKLLNKVITIDNCKYTDIFYINNNLSTSGILNLIHWLNKTYNNIADFEFQIYIDSGETNELYDVLQSHYQYIKKKEI